MRKTAYLFACFTIALALAAGPALAAPPLPLAESPESVGFDSARLKKLDDYMAGVVAEGRVAGMTTLLARHGKIVQSKVYGQGDLAKKTAMTADAIFRIFSMSKPITGVAMMILFEEGKWRLDDPVTRFIPEFKNLRVMTSVDAQGKMLTEPMRRPPTMRELMSHTAGFGYGLSKTPIDNIYLDKQVLFSKDLHQMIERIADIPLKYQPGTNWAYSSAVDIQGYIIEKLSGQTLGAFLEQRLFKPLKMTDTGFFVRAGAETRLAQIYGGDPATGKIIEASKLLPLPLPIDTEKLHGMESGGAGLTSTTADYARFAQMLANKGELDGAHILSPASVELMDTNVIPHDVLLLSPGLGDNNRFNETVGFGLDLRVVNDPRRYGSLEGKNSMNWSGAAGTWFWVDPTNDLIFVGMIQRLGGTGGDDLATQARTLTYQALLHPEK